MNHQEPTDPAWELLKQAKRVEPSPFFVRNVVREARLLDPVPSGIWARVRSAFGQRGMLTATAVCGAVTLTAVLLNDQGKSNGRGETMPVVSILEDHSDAFDPASEMAAIEYLGQLMAVADPGQLEDAALADLFF